MEGEQLRLMAAQGFSHPEQIIDLTFPVADELLLETRKSDKPIILADAKTESRFKKWAGTDYVRGWMGVPLIARSEVIGFITLDSRTPSAYDTEKAMQAQAFALQAVMAIENARCLRLNA